MEKKFFLSIQILLICMNYKFQFKISHLFYKVFYLEVYHIISVVNKRISDFLIKDLLLKQLRNFSNFFEV
jgi:hypothetical protein